jgi:hypothetical protein
MFRSKAVVGVVVLFEGVVACGSSDSHRNVPVEAGVNSGGSQGTGGRAGTGGRVGSGGAPATGGKVGSGGAGIKDAAPPEAGAETGAPEAGPPPACPAATDGGPQWRDVAAGVCKACPATAVSCADLLAAPGPSYDPASRILTLHVTPGLTELVGVNLQYSADFTRQDGGAAFFNGAASARVRGNTMTFDFSRQLPESTYFIGNGSLSFKDACGTATTDNNYDFRINVTQNPDGGRNLVSIQCGVL